MEQQHNALRLEPKAPKAPAQVRVRVQRVHGGCEELVQVGCELADAALLAVQGQLWRALWEYLTCLSVAG